MSNKINASGKFNLNGAIDLSPEQRNLVETFQGIHLVLGGPKTGKSTVLGYRVAHMIDCGIDPASILILTPTKKSALNAFTCAAKLIGSRVNGVTSSSFYSFAYKISHTYNDESIPVAALDSADELGLIELMLHTDYFTNIPITKEALYDNIQSRIR
jgi:superfamily I DNA/RNA helicase